MWDSALSNYKVGEHYTSQFYVISTLRLHHPNVVVADIPFWWVTAIAADLGIPRITFHAVGVFSQLVMNNFLKIRFKILELENGSEPIMVLDFAGPPINIPKSELLGFLRSPDYLTEGWDGPVKESQLGSYGMVVNTFHELEPRYCDLFRKMDCKRAWLGGPRRGGGVGGRTGTND